MQESEVSLRIAMKYIQDGMTSKDVDVSIDGAHIQTKGTIHFDIESFMRNNGYRKLDGKSARWQGAYENPLFVPKIVISSKPGVGDVNIVLNDGHILFIESKKIKSGSSGEYPPYAGSNRPADDRLSGSGRCHSGCCCSVYRKKCPACAGVV